MNDPLDEAADPKLEEDPSRNGLYCFIDSNRECGSDCMAYTTGDSESPSLSIQQKNCALLVSAERLGRFMGGLVSISGKVQQAAAKEAADRARTSHPAPPNPRGTTT